MSRAAAWAGGCLVAFLLLLADVLAAGWLTRVDQAVEDALAGALTASVRARLGFWLSLPGDAWLTAPMVALAAIVSFVRGRPRLGGVVAVAGIVGHVVVGWLKDAIGRARPPAGVDLESLAFPSGHATQAAVAWGLAYLVAVSLWTGAGDRSSVGVSAGAGRLAAAVCLVAVATVGLGRVLGGVHWLTDVLAGWSLGGAVVATAMFAVGKWGAEGDEAGG